MTLLSVKKIAVLRANSLGDFIFCLPALEALRAAYRAAEITFLGKPWHVGFLEDRPGPIDRCIAVPYSKGVHEPPRGQDEDREKLRFFFSQMQHEQFDIAIQMHGGGRYSNPFVSRLRSRISAGMQAPDAPSLDRTIPYTLYHPEVLRYLEVVSLVGATPVHLEPSLTVTERDSAETDAALGSLPRPVAVLHPGATDPRRRWPEAYFAQIGDRLAARGFTIILTGDRADKPLIDRIHGMMKGRAQSAAGILSLHGLTGLMARADLVLSNDTGPLHLARAVGARTIGIYWIGNIITAGPLSLAKNRSCISWKLNCPVCGVNCIAGSCGHDASFVADVSVEEVWSTVEQIAAGTGISSAGLTRPLARGNLRHENSRGDL